MSALIERLEALREWLDDGAPEIERGERGYYLATVEEALRSLAPSATVPTDDWPTLLQFKAFHGGVHAQTEREWRQWQIKVRELLAAAPAASEQQDPVKRACFGIVNQDGVMYKSESCISSDAESLQEELQYAQENDPDDQWRIAPMYFDAPPLTPQAAQTSGCDPLALAKSLLVDKDPAHLTRMQIMDIANALIAASLRTEVVAHPDDLARLRKLIHGCDCANPAQCWEPCGTLGHHEAHAQVVDERK